MRAYTINVHLLVPRSRSSAKVKVKYKGYNSQKMAVFGDIRVSQTHLVCLILQFSKFESNSTFDRLWFYQLKVVLLSTEENHEKQD